MLVLVILQFLAKSIKQAHVAPVNDVSNTCDFFFLHYTAGCYAVSWFLADFLLLLAAVVALHKRLRHDHAFLGAELAR